MRNQQIQNTVEHSSSREPRHALSRDERRIARTIRVSNYADFVTDLATHLENQRLCKRKDVRRSLSFMSIEANSSTINMHLRLKPRKKPILVVDYVAFDDEFVSGPKSLIEFFLCNACRYGIEEIRVTRPIGLPDKILTEFGFEVRNRGKNWSLSVQ